MVAPITGAPQRGFHLETPGQCPVELAEFMPKGAKWVRSDSFDSEMTGETYSGMFYLDPDTDTVYFDTLNPRITASSGP